MKSRSVLLGLLATVFVPLGTAQETWRSATFTQLSPPPHNQAGANPPIYPTANGNSPQVAYAHGAWYFVDGNFFEPRIFDPAITPNGDFVESEEDTHFASRPESTPGAEYVKALAAGDDTLFGISNLDGVGSLANWESAVWDDESNVPNAGFDVRDLTYSPWLNRWIATSLTISTRITSGGWTVRRNSTGDPWTGVTSGPDGIVAVSSTGKYTFSANGLSWSTGTISGSTSFEDVHYADGTYVAVGEGRIYSSTNGTSWFLRRDDPGSGLVSVTYGNKTWVAIQGDGQRIHYSTDGGLTWLDDLTITSPVPLSEITFGQGLFVAIGVNGNIRWSPVELGLVEPSFTFTSSASGTQSTGVTSGWADNAWCASSPADWISFTGIFLDEPEGTGPGGLGFSLSANPGAGRSACVEVNGRPATIRQDGPGGPDPRNLPIPRLFPLEDAVLVVWDDADGETGYLLERFGLGAGAWTVVANLPADEHYFIEHNGGFENFEGTSYRYRVTTEFSGPDGSSQESAEETYPVTNADVVAVQFAPDKVLIARNNNFGGDPIAFSRNGTALAGPVNDFTLVDNLPGPHEPGDLLLSYTVENIFNTAIAAAPPAPVWQFAGPEYGFSEPIAATMNLLSWEPPFVFQYGAGGISPHPERFKYKISYAVGGSSNFATLITVDSPCFVDAEVTPGVMRAYRVEPIAVRTGESIGTFDLCPRYPARPLAFLSFGPDQTTILFYNWRFSDFNADTWVIERRVNGGGWNTPVEIAANGLEGSGVLTGLTPGDLYEFRIGSNWRGATSAWKTYGPIKADLETPVLQVITTPGPNKIFINWTTLNGADTYEVQRSLDGTTGWSTIASGLTSSQYTDNTVSALTTYHYRVRGIHQWDTSDWSNVLSATPPLELFLVHNYHDERKFEYVPPPSYTQAILQRDDFSSFSNPVTVDSYNYNASFPNTIMIDDEDAPLTRYYYRVRFRVGVNVVYTDFVTVYTPVEPPTNLVANPVPDQERIFLSWTAPSGGVNYDIERRELAPTLGFWDLIKVDLGTTIYIDETTQNGSTYQYRVYGKGGFPYWQPSRPSNVEQVVLDNSIALWRFDHFGTIVNSGDAANSADPDDGGLDNLGELLAGTDPNNPNDDQLLFIENVVPNSVSVTFELREDYLTWPVDFTLQSGNNLDGPLHVDVTPPAPESGTASFFQHIQALPAPFPTSFYQLNFAEAAP